MRDIKKKTIVDMLVVACVLIMFSSIAGCSSWHYKRYVLTSEGEAVKVVDARGSSFVIDSDVSKVHAASDANGRELSIGEIKQEVNTETAKAIAEGVIAGLSKVIRP